MTDGKHEAPSTGFMSDSTYEALRFLAVIVLPALGALYFGLSQIWGLPKAEEVVGTIVVLDTFVGVVLRAARKSYENSDGAYDGHMFVGPGETPDAKTVGLQVTTPPQDLEGKKAVRFKIHEQR